MEQIRHRLSDSHNETKWNGDRKCQSNIKCYKLCFLKRKKPKVVRRFFNFHKWTPQLWKQWCLVDKIYTKKSQKSTPINTLNFNLTTKSTEELQAVFCFEVSIRGGSIKQLSLI